MGASATNAQGSIDGLFYAVGGVLAVIRDVRPDVENIGFGEWGKDTASPVKPFEIQISDGWPAMPRSSGKFNYNISLSIHKTRLVAASPSAGSYHFLARRQSSFIA